MKERFFPDGCPEPQSGSKQLRRKTLEQQSIHRTVALHTLGCKVNQYESDAIAEKFVKAGYTLGDFRQRCDVYVINTCTVTGEAGRKSRQLIHRARQQNPQAIVVAMGCHTEIAGEAMHADIVLGNRNKQSVVERVESYRATQCQSCDVQSEQRDVPPVSEPSLFRRTTEDGPIHELREFEEMGPVTSREASRAFIKIEDGCNNFCSYCIIPYARGRVRSRDEETILREARALAAAGYREIVLTGIHVCSYGADRGRNSEALAELVRTLSGIDGIERIRLGSLEPDSVTPRFLEILSEAQPLCPHFHLSLQSGSDRVLARMNRRYTTDGFCRTVAGIKAHFPDATITTDIIAGFPGETEEEHRETMAFCTGIGFMNMHVFKYSRREGTRAADRTDQVSPELIVRRSAELIALSEKMHRQALAAAVGRKYRVLIETVRDEQAYGYTENYLPAQVGIGKGIGAGKNVEVVAEDAGTAAGIGSGAGIGTGIGNVNAGLLLSGNIVTIKAKTCSEDALLGEILI
jgi:threonylcarbamoyladenosine tRNA methylthiotransferase MtaB